MAHYHFVGVGGYSMSGIAMVLHRMGYTVSGSDARASSRTERVRREGIPVVIGHRTKNVQGADVVVYSTDVPQDNVEMKEARRRGLRLIHRSEALGELIAGHRSIAVTGTHGKPTTSSLTGHLLIEAGLDPMVMVGGEVESFGGSARLGRGDWIVLEADESDGSFLRYQPTHAVITNMEPEHLEHYEGSFDRVREAYRAFARSVQGRLALHSDPRLDEVAAATSAEVVRYGPGGDLRAENVRDRSGGGHTFDIVGPQGRLASAEVVQPGLHNVDNALAALLMAEAAGVPMDEAAAALTTFRNAHRRFEVHLAGPITVVDDYGHHPTEIRAVLKAARELQPDRLIVAFQPQRFTRTKNLWTEFVAAFDEADIAVLTEIYSPAGEMPIAGVSGRLLAQAVQDHCGRPVLYAKTLADVVSEIERIAKPGDLIVTMGAGDIVKVAEHLRMDLGGPTAASMT